MPREDWNAYTLQRRYIGNPPTGESGMFSLRDVNEMQSLPFKGHAWEGEHLVVWAGSRSGSASMSGSTTHYHSYNGNPSGHISLVSTSSKAQSTNTSGMNTSLIDTAATTYQSSHSLCYGGYTTTSYIGDVRQYALASNTVNNSFGTIGNYRSAGVVMSDGSYSFYAGGYASSANRSEIYYNNMASGGSSTGYGNLHTINSQWKISCAGSVQFPNGAYGIVIAGAYEPTTASVTDDIRKINFNRSTSGSTSWNSELYQPDRARGCGIQGEVRFCYIGGDYGSGSYATLNVCTQMAFADENMSILWGELATTNAPSQSGASSRAKGYVVGGMSYNGSSFSAIKTIRQLYPDRGNVGFDTSTGNYDVLTSQGRTDWTDFKNEYGSDSYIAKMPGVSTAG